MPMPEASRPGDPHEGRTRILSDLCDWALSLAETEGAPQFTAAMMDGDTEICRARNDVARTHDPSRHAEIAAIAGAGRQLGRPDLAGHTLRVLPALRDVPCRDALGAESTG